jgi:hypothetical protein
MRKASTPGSANIPSNRIPIPIPPTPPPRSLRVGCGSMREAFSSPEIEDSEGTEVGEQYPN